MRNKAIATNEGMPPTLCQEAACGLAVGTTGALINFPLYSGYLVYNYHLATKRFPSYRYVFSFVRNMATQRALFREMWNYVGPFLKRKMWLDMGMLASYNPSLDYLRESCGFSEAKAQLGKSSPLANFISVPSFPFLSCIYMLCNFDCVLLFRCKCFVSILCCSMQFTLKTHSHSQTRNWIC